MKNRWRLLMLSMRAVAGPRYWMAPLLPLVWVALQVLRVVLGAVPGGFVPADAFLSVIGIPMAVLGLGLGLRVIAGEVDRRTLEIAYTVPGGTHRVWLYKLAACLLLLLAALALLAGITYLVFTDFTLATLYSSLQVGIFCMVLGMGTAALLKSESGGALLALPVLILLFFFQAWQFSPFWNPDATSLTSADPRDLLGWTVQNRIGLALLIAALTVLAFGRAEQRERMLGD